jgi:hypothetical protein
MMEPKKTKAPKTLSSHGTHRSNSPPPKSAQLEAYVLIIALGMAPTCYGAGSLTAHLQEETWVSLRDIHGCSAFRVVVGHMVDPSAYGIAAHHPSIAGLQQLKRCARVGHARIEPSVIAVPLAT